MTITVKVNCNAKSSSVVEKDGDLVVNMNIKPIDGKANEMLLDLLSKYYDVAKSSISIVRGHKSRVKIIEINKKI